MLHPILVITGDGIDPELTLTVIRVFDALDCGLTRETQHTGVTASQVVTGYRIARDVGGVSG